MFVDIVKNTMAGTLNTLISNQPKRKWIIKAYV